MVATGVDRLYRDDDIPTGRNEELLVRAFASLARIHEIPVIVTRAQDDDFPAPVANAAVTRLVCQQTPFGPRFEDEVGETETLVYHVDEGWMQTLLAYWQEVLEHRARIHEASTLERTAGPVGMQ